MREHNEEWVKNKIQANLMTKAKSFKRIENKLKYLTIKQLQLLKRVIDEWIKKKMREKFQKKK